MSSTITVHSTSLTNQKVFSLAVAPEMAPARVGEVLAHTGDIYDGVAVDAEQLPQDPAEFAQLLKISLEVCIPHKDW